MRSEIMTFAVLIVVGGFSLFGFAERAESSVEPLDDRSQLFSTAFERQRLDGLKKSGQSTEDSEVLTRDIEQGDKPIEFKGYITNGAGRVLMYHNSGFKSVSSEGDAERRGTVKPPTLTVLEDSGQRVELKVGQVYSRQR